LALKSIAAQMVNSIVIPVIVAYKIKDENIYYTNGLVDTIFMLAVTNSLLPPLLTLVDPGYQILRLKRWYYTHPCSFILIQIEGSTSLRNSLTHYKKVLPLKSETNILIK